MQDTRVANSVLEIIENMLKMNMGEDGGNRMCRVIKEAGGFKMLQGLQTRASDGTARRKVCQRAVRILETYFSEDESDEDGLSGAAAMSSQQPAATASGSAKPRAINRNSGTGGRQIARGMESDGCADAGSGKASSAGGAGDRLDGLGAALRRLLLRAGKTMEMLDGSCATHCLAASSIDVHYHRATGKHLEPATLGFAKLGALLKALEARGHLELFKPPGKTHLMVRAPRGAPRTAARKKSATGGAEASACASAAAAGVGGKKKSAAADTRIKLEELGRQLYGMLRGTGNMPLRDLGEQFKRVTGHFLNPEDFGFMGPRRAIE